MYRKFLWYIPLLLILEWNFFLFHSFFVGFKRNRFIYFQDVIVQKDWYKKFGQKILRKKQPKNLYKRIKEQLKADKSWPMVGKFTFSEAPIETDDEYDLEKYGAYVHKTHQASQWSLFR